MWELVEISEIPAKDLLDDGNCQRTDIGSAIRWYPLWLEMVIPPTQLRSWLDLRSGSNCGSKARRRNEAAEFSLYQLG
jgi:hypothetical protein